MDLNIFDLFQLIEDQFFSLLMLTLTFFDIGVFFKLATKSFGMALVDFDSFFKQVILDLSCMFSAQTWN